MHAPSFLYGKTFNFQYIACDDSWQVCYFVQQDNMIHRTICKGLDEIIIGNNGWLIVSSSSASDLDVIFWFGYMEILKLAHFPRVIKAALHLGLLHLFLLVLCCKMKFDYFHYFNIGKSEQLVVQVFSFPSGFNQSPGNWSFQCSVS